MLIRKTFFCRFNFAVSQFDRSKDYYKILGVTRTANQLQIKKAFYSLAKKTHPDATRGQQRIFKQYNEAFNVLSKPLLREEYDVAIGATSYTRSSSAQFYNTSSSSTYKGSASTHHSHNHRTQNSSASQSHAQEEEEDESMDYWKRKEYRNQFVNQMLRAQQFRSRNEQRSFKTQDVRAKTNAEKSSKSDSDYVRAYMADFMNKNRQDSEFMRKVREQESKARRKEEEDEFRKREEIRKKANQALHQGQDILSKPVEKIAEVGKKAWDWFTKKK